MRSEEEGGRVEGQEEVRSKGGVEWRWAPHGRANWAEGVQPVSKWRTGCLVRESKAHHPPAGLPGSHTENSRPVFHSGNGSLFRSGGENDILNVYLCKALHKYFNSIFTPIP